MKENRLIVLLTVALFVVFAAALLVGCGGSEKNYAWHKDNVADLGTSARAWKDAYLKGTYYSDGTAMITDGAFVAAQLRSGVTVKKVVVASSGTSGTATVTAGQIVLGGYGVANIHDTAYNGVSSINIAGTTLTLTINGTAGGNAAIYNVSVM